MRALRLPMTLAGRLMASPPGSTRCSLVRFQRQGAIPLDLARSVAESRAAISRGRPWGLTGSWVIHPVALPWSQTPTGRVAPRSSGTTRAAPAPNTAKAPAKSMMSRLNPTASVPAVYASRPRCHGTRKTRFRLAAHLYRGGVEPPGSRTRFQVVGGFYISFSLTRLGLSLAPISHEHPVKPPPEVA